MFVPLFNLILAGFWKSARCTSRVKKIERNGGKMDKDKRLKEYLVKLLHVEILRESV